ncbi:MAG: tetratricopeptide repeat protein [Caldilineaceae bacterium]
MSFIYIQLIPRAQTFAAGEMITLRFPLDTTNPERDLTITNDVAPLLGQAETDYYVPDLLHDAARLQRVGQTLYRWLDGDDRFLARAIEPLQGKHKAVALLIEQGAGLDHLPWELLHDGAHYLVQQSPTAVIPVRWTRGNVPASATQAQNRPLHVAFMATAPEGLQPELDFEGEEARIMAATKAQPLRLSVEESGNLEQLGRLLGELGEGAVDVVHLTGHATHTPDGPCFLCEDEVGGRQPATADAIAESLTYLPRLLFLSGCRTGQALQEGEVPSLAAALVTRGLPAVLGWGQPVFDPDATTAAATLYDSLAQGFPLVRALAETYQEMLRRHLQNPQECRHWHLLRLYARGETPPPNLPQGGGTVGGLGALVTAPGAPKRTRLTIPQREPHYLDEEGQRVPVAQRRDFVGRRRVLQACLRALRPAAEELGVLLYGLGGQGKSTLAHRLRQRWRQRSEEHQAVVLYGALDEALLLRKLNNGLATSPTARETLNGRDTLRFRLLNTLTSCNEQLLIILDNFEDNFEQSNGAPRLVAGSPLLTGSTVQLLADLLYALRASNDQGQHHRLLITSRYLPTWPGVDALAIYQLDRLNAAAVDKKVSRLTAQDPLPATGDQTHLRERAIAIADGNPRLLEWLFALLAQAPSATLDMDPDMDRVLVQMAAQETALRENILAGALLAGQTPACRQMLARGLSCELPVPAAVFDALDQLGPTLLNTAPERARATALGLLEATTQLPLTTYQSPTYLRVPRILAPLLTSEQQPPAATLAATAARTLQSLWWDATDANPSEAQLLELHRLALAGGENVLAAAIANRLAGRWNRADQYRYREVIDLVTRTVAQSANARLWNQIGYAKDQLGEKQAASDHYQAALAACPATEAAFRGTIVNNLGGVYSDLGEKQEALRYYNLALPLRRQVGDKGGEATTLNNLGGVYSDLGKKQEALRYYNLALPLRRQVGDKGGEATTLNNLGAVYRSLGDMQEALRYYNLALPLRCQVGDKGGEAATLNNLGLVYDALGEKQEALRYFNLALPLYRQVGDRWGESVTRYNLAMVYEHLGQLAEAVAELEQVVALDEAVGHPDLANDRATLERVRAKLGAKGNEL